jgi:hypothetical protein
VARDGRLAHHASVASRHARAGAAVSTPTGGTLRARRRRTPR